MERSHVEIKIVVKRAHTAMDLSYKLNSHVKQWHGITLAQVACEERDGKKLSVINIPARFADYEKRKRLK